MNPNLPLIVGESNPYGVNPHYALYPEPDGCAGWRLCHLVMGLRRGTYMSSFERVNLLQGSKWSAPEARHASAGLFERGWQGKRVMVLLGRRVAEAFLFKGAELPSAWDYFSVFYVLLPHPSGRNRVWNAEMVKTCRELLNTALPDIPFGEVERNAVAGARDIVSKLSPIREAWIVDCPSCASEPDYRGPCDCAHAPCVHQQPAVTDSGALR